MILVVDDDVVVRLMVRETLEQAGFPVEEAEDGEQALSAVKRLRPELVLLDVMMPGMDGYEVCRELKADEKTKDIPVIFLSARDSDSDVVKGFELGAVDYITKPISQEILRVRVHAQTMLKRQRDLLISLLDKRAKELQKYYAMTCTRG